MSDRFDLDHLDDGDFDDDFDELAALRAMSRGPAPEVWETPPADLWARIEAEALGTEALGTEAPGTELLVTGGSDTDDAQTDSNRIEGAGSHPIGLGATRIGSTRVEAVDEEVGPEIVALDEAIDEPVTAPVVPLRSSGRRRPPWLMAAAAVAAAVVVVVGLVVVSDDGTDEPELLASVTLDVLAGAGSGRVDLVDASGVRQIRLDTADLDAGDGFLEVWLIDPTVSKLVSLGPLRPDGVYDLPDGVDPAEFPIVDISAEPVDGDPTHSGNSLLRGQLTI